MEGFSPMIRQITGIVLGVVAFLLVYWLTGLGNPSSPNLALAALVGLVVALIWPWLFGIYVVRRHRAKQQEDINKQVQEEVSKQQNLPPS